MKKASHKKQLCKLAAFLTAVILLFCSCQSPDTASDTLSRMNALFCEIFTCPDSKIVSSTLFSSEKSDDLHNELFGSDIEKLRKLASGIYGAYISSDYLDDFFDDTGKAFHLTADELGGTSSLSSVSFYKESPNARYGFIAHVSCENSSGTRTSIKLTGHFDIDNNEMINSFQIESGKESYTLALR